MAWCLARNVPCCPARLRRDVDVWPTSGVRWETCRDRQNDWPAAVPEGRQYWRHRILSTSTYRDLLTEERRRFSYVEDVRRSLPCVSAAGSSRTGTRFRSQAFVRSRHTTRQPIASLAYRHDPLSLLAYYLPSYFRGIPYPSALGQLWIDLQVHSSQTSKPFVSPSISGR